LTDPRAVPRLLEATHEASLRDRLVARDERALVELIDVASPWLLSIAQGMLHDVDEAEEVVMEAFRTVWQNIPALRGDHTALIPYLMRVTRHRSIDRLRGRKRRLLKAAAAAREVDSPSVRPVEPDEAGQPGWMVHTQVHDALKALPAEQQEVVRLAYFEGHTQSEIATELGIPLGTVKTRLRLAFGRLRTALAGIKDWVA
jgi:RNA polymerase sigma-70 factor, ECF subfamily